MATSLPPSLKLAPSSKLTAAPAMLLVGRYHALVELFGTNHRRDLCRQTKLSVSPETPVMVGSVHVVPSKFCTGSAPLQATRKLPPAVAIMVVCQ